MKKGQIIKLSMLSRANRIASKNNDVLIVQTNLFSNYGEVLEVKSYNDAKLSASELIDLINAAKNENEIAEILPPDEKRKSVLTAAKNKIQTF